MDRRTRAAASDFNILVVRFDDHRRRPPITDGFPIYAIAISVSAFLSLQQFFVGNRVDSAYESRIGIFPRLLKREA